MQVVKRDGTFAEYDRTKIAVAIGKANADVEESERASEKEIKEILEYIEHKNRKRMLVEDIQDIIEERLMAFGHYELAKKYIIYRFTRALIRKAVNASLDANVRTPEIQVEGGERYGTIEVGQWIVDYIKKA